MCLRSLFRRVVAHLLVYLSKHRVQVRAGLGDVVNVEAGIDFHDGIESIVELVTSGVVGVVWVWEDWEGSGRWWKLEVRVQVLRVVALPVSRLEAFDEAVIQKQTLLPVAKKWANGDLLSRDSTNEGIVDGDTLQVDVRIGGSDEGVCNVGHVKAGITLTG